jgi:sugar phosphate isomerase/epimerase
MLIKKNMKQVLSSIHVNIPFTMLKSSHLELFISNGLNPEIGLDAQALDTSTTDEFKAIARQLKHHQLKTTIHGPFKDLSPASQDSKIRLVTRRRLEQVLSIAPIFSPISVVCHPGYDWKRFAYYRNEWVEESVSLWQWFAEALAAHGIRLMLENVYEEQPEELLVLFERLAPNQVGFCFDTGHMAAFSRAPIERWLTVLGPYIQQCHLHDNQGMSDDHIALGKGTIDFKVLFDYLKAERSVPPVITLEPHEEKNLWPSVQYLESHWPF